jgi:hypothetical protein
MEKIDGLTPRQILVKGTTQGVGSRMRITPFRLKTKTRVCLTIARALANTPVAAK